MGINILLKKKKQSKHWSPAHILLLLEFWPYPSKHWNTDPTPPSFEILTLSLQTLEV